MYLVHHDAKKGAHIWTGRDTLCRMYSTGGLGKKPLRHYEIDDAPKGRKVCGMCRAQSYKAQVAELVPHKTERKKGEGRPESVASGYLLGIGAPMSYAAHIWTGTDNLCRTWSTGGIRNKNGYVVRPDPEGHPVCKNCLNIQMLQNPDAGAPERPQDAFSAPTPAYPTAYPDKRNLRGLGARPMKLPMGQSVAGFFVSDASVRGLASEYRISVEEVRDKISHMADLMSNGMLRTPEHALDAWDMVHEFVSKPWVYKPLPLEELYGLDKGSLSNA